MSGEALIEQTPAEQAPAGQTPAKRKPRRLLIALLIIFLLILGAGGFVAYDAHRFLNAAPGQPGVTVIYTVEQGASFNRVARDLKDLSVITDTLRFRILARVYGAEPRLRAGVFQFNTGWNPRQVLYMLTTRGDMPVMACTIREGLTWWQVARQLEAEGYVTFDQFRDVIHDPAFLAEHGIPFANAEGFLFPDTYQIAKPFGAPTPERTRAIASRLVGTFWLKTADFWPDGPPPIDDLKRAVILASLVEKETGRADERARVAGVYDNRLTKGMLMQADPTTIYGLGPGFNGNLRRAQLNDPANPYNTYQHKGLPPGPICSPGLEAIAAALDPEKHDYLFFVSRNDGSHQFSKNLKDHINAVNRYQRQ